MTVYLLIRDIPYEGYEVVEVFLHPGPAKAKAAKLQEGEEYATYGVDSWEVNDDLLAVSEAPL